MLTPTHLFVHKADIWRSTQMLDDGGCPMQFSVLHLSDVACRINPTPDFEVIVRQGVKIVATHVMYCGDVDVKAPDRVKLADGVEYRVVMDMEPDLQGVFKKLALEQIV